MMKLKFFLIFLLFTPGYLKAQWEMQLDIQNFTYLDRIFFLNENLGWAIGGGSIGGLSPYFYTTDGGENWYLDDEWYNIEGSDIVFVNPDTGFIAGGYGVIYKTVNGGQSWTGIQTPATQNVIHLFFVDENNGWATLGQYSEGNILHTLDGGDTWALQQVFLSLTSQIEVIYFLNDCIGYGGGVIHDYINDDTYTAIMKTENQGVLWDTIYLSKNTHYSFYDIYFYDKLNGWAVGRTPYEYLILHTNNNGETWEEQTIAGTPEPNILSCIYFINDTTGWIGSVEPEYGAIYFTNNGGEDWQMQQEFYVPIWDIQMLNRDIGWAIGFDHIYHTTNGDTIIVNNIKDNIQKNDLLKVIPNPFYNTIQLQISKENQFSEIVITDVTGKTCFQGDKSTSNPLNLSFLQKGMYFLTIKYTINKQINFLTKKIIKL
jgi:photosystem II stability/assembly factor-like uncharacterized protein